MIRFLLDIFLVTVFLIISIPFLIIGWLLGKINRPAIDMAYMHAVQMIFKLLMFVAGANITYIGLENLPKDHSVLYVGNHRSYFDTMMTYAVFPAPTGFIAKKEMAKVPLIYHWMKFIHCLFLDRHDLKQGLQTILTGIEMVKAGTSICIFPEGTRNRTDNICLPFHEGSLKIAVKGKVPVIPISIVGSSAIWEDQFPRMKKANVICEFGKPIIIDELEPQDKKFPGAYVQKQIENMYIENSKKVPR